LKINIKFINGKLILSLMITLTNNDMDNDNNEDAKLTPEQIKNWRNILLGMIGPYALLMPDEEVQQIRDIMQANLSEE
jgi:hypothetical protein